MSRRAQSVAPRDRFINEEDTNRSRSPPPTIGLYQRFMAEQATRGPVVDPYWPPNTESRRMNGEGSSRTMVGVPTRGSIEEEHRQARMIQILDAGLVRHKEVLDEHHKRIVWTIDQVDALWFLASKEKRAKEKLQNDLKITWFLMLLMFVMLAYALYH